MATGYSRGRSKKDLAVKENRSTTGQMSRTHPSGNASDVSFTTIRPHAQRSTGVVSTTELGDNTEAIEDDKHNISCLSVH